MDEPRVMLLAGGTGSIGRVIAGQALAAGWRVALHGSSTQSLDDCVAQLNAGDTLRNLFVLSADIRDPGATEQLVTKASGWAGRLDAVIDCVSTGPVGVRVTGPFADTEPNGYAALLE